MSSTVSTNASAPSSSKKRRFEPIPEAAPPNLAKASDLLVLHQTTELSLLYLRHPQTSWHCQGRTSLYVINAVPGNFALHLRGSCRVKDLTVETLQSNTSPADTNDGPTPMDIDEGSPPPQSASLVSLSVSFQHDDPLTHVLVKPAKSFTEGDDDHAASASDSSPRFDADSQWVRGASGMTTGLRAASIASYMGELRVSMSSDDHDAVNKQKRHVISKDDAKAFWTNELQDLHSNKEGSVAEELTTQLFNRSKKARESRVELIAQKLADASVVDEQEGSKTNGGGGTAGKVSAMKVTITYEVMLDRMPHLAGIHSSHGHSPHVYTTTGVLGDHEGPRCWVPCLDSALSKHRASHDIVVKVTAPMRDGLSVVGCGQDYGVSKTMVHDMVSIPPLATEYLGESHIDMVRDTVQKSLCQSVRHCEQGTAPHVIPPDPSSIDSVLATTVWASHIWTPSPIRSLGFAVGPFKVLEDPEYFSEENEDDEDVEDGTETDQSAFVESARQNGEGIRQVYFSPLFERKYIHLSADARLLHNTTFELPALGSDFLKISQDLDQAVTVSTVGVPLRALTLMRDVLALPTYRTASYTQIWIPNAVHGGSTSGALHCCPDVLVNPFLGGSIMDSRLLSPVGSRLPFYNGGRVLQLMQARCVIRGWITAALPLGECDDVGFGYIHTLVESFLMNIYERGHGAYGEGGAKNGIFFSKRYAEKSGLNSSALDFLPVANIEEGELDAMVGGLIGAVPIEDRNSDQLWRTASNGTESHTSALDELGVRQVLYKDSVEALERVTGSEKEKDVPLPSLGYMGSHLSLSFLTSNSTSSSELGCGAFELLHPVGGMTYRSLKCEVLRRVVEGRAGVANFIRLVRAAFIAAHLEDMGKTEIQDEEWQAKPKAKPKKTQDKTKTADGREQPTEHAPKTRPPFLLCVDELLKKHGLTHPLFTRALRILAGPMREPQLRGSLVDVERETSMPGSGRHFVEPENFPNSYVRGASEVYLRVGAHVEPAGTADGASAKAASSGTPKGTQLHVLAEPVIPKGGIAFGGPITVRVVENEGQLREFVRSVSADGSRSDWGPIFLHAKPVTTAKQQTAASGTIETGPGSRSKGDDGSGSATAAVGDSKTLASPSSDFVFTESFLHKGGYQSIELIRLTNRTPLLWVRVDPMGTYGGRIAVIQPDACAAEQLFHDGDSGAQVDALRALAERPFRIQGSVKITTVYDTDVSELPVRVLADCLRGSPALHSSLPHTPAVRVQAALAIAQWQNNKSSVGIISGKADFWIGLKLLLQYFRERFYENGSIVPLSFTRVAVKKSEDHLGKNSSKDASAGNPKTGDSLYQYLDTMDAEDRRSAMTEADDIEIEEDEEYRVRSAVVQAIASVRGEDGSTPSAVLHFLEEVLVSGDSSMVGSSLRGENDFVEQNLSENDAVDDKKFDASLTRIAALSYVPSIIVADALLSLSSINASAELTSGAEKSTAKHPVLPLILKSHRWLEWELYRETIRSEAEASSLSGVGGGTHSTVAACAVTALYSLCILKQSTTDPDQERTRRSSAEASSRTLSEEDLCDVASSTEFYVNIFNQQPLRDDVTRAACAQAIACIFCAADRIEVDSKEPIGLLSALEFVLDQILDVHATLGLRHTLALLMMDACTGKICSMQRVGAVGGRGDLCASAARLLTGPLGASYGGDNGSAMLMAVSEFSYPAANAVNDGARRGLALLKRAGGIKDESTSNQTIARIARFATSLWRTINGDNAPPPSATSLLLSSESCGICAFDGQLRCSLLSVFQWLWPTSCSAVMRVQAWEQLMGGEQYKQLGADLVMSSSEAEMKEANEEEDVLIDIKKFAEKEIDRQRWRGEMAAKSYEYYQYDKSRKAPTEVSVGSETGTGQPLPVVKRDDAFKQGGWIASAAQQRRASMLDGGPRGTKVRLKMKSNDTKA